MSEIEKNADGKKADADCGCAADATGSSAPDADHSSVKSDGPRMPEVTFTTFALSLASSGLVQLGEVPDPESGQTSENLLMAKHTIDVLSMLREKTEGCLDEDEKKLLDALLYELRMKYVLKSK
ncbi:MAG: hypothetical protein DELT_00146 [Desulfovibrio sp.]